MSENNAVNLEILTKNDIPAEVILEKAKEPLKAGAIVLGWDQDDNLYFASSFASAGSILLLLELAKHELFMALEEQEG